MVRRPLFWSLLVHGFALGGAAVAWQQAQPEPGVLVVSASLTHVEPEAPDDAEAVEELDPEDVEFEEFQDVEPIEPLPPEDEFELPEESEAVAELPVPLLPTSCLRRKDAPH